MSSNGVTVNLLEFISRICLHNDITVNCDCSHDIIMNHFKIGYDYSEYPMKEDIYIYEVNIKNIIKFTICVSSQGNLLYKYDKIIHEAQTGRCFDSKLPYQCMTKVSINWKVIESKVRKSMRKDKKSGISEYMKALDKCNRFIQDSENKDDKVEEEDNWEDMSSSEED